MEMLDTKWLEVKTIRRNIVLKPILMVSELSSGSKKCCIRLENFNTPKRRAMTANQFRRLALNLPDATESSHMNHPDFRVAGKIFATLGPKEAWGMVKLTPKQQAVFIKKHPNAFEPINGAWGRNGSTKVLLKTATKAAVTPALVAAWTNIAPQSLLEESGDA